MKIDVNNFYILERDGKPIIFSENYETDESIETDYILQMSFSRVAESLTKNIYKLEYKDVIHYITNIDHKIIVVGFIVNDVSKNEFVSNMTFVLQKFDFKKYGLETISDTEIFDQITDVVIKDIESEFHRLSDVQNVQFEMKLTEGLIAE